MSNNPIVIVNGVIELFNYNFLDISEFHSIAKKNVVIRSCTFIELLGDGLPKRHYCHPNGDLDVAKTHKFHRNLVEVFNMFKGSVKEIHLENYRFINDDHFKFMHTFVWESLDSLKLIKCWDIGKNTFRWIANNCMKLKVFDLTYGNLPLDPIYQIQYGEYHEDQDVFYHLDEQDLIHFFNNNAKTLETCQMQVKHLGWTIFDSAGTITTSEIVLQAVRNCKCLKNVNFMLESYDFGDANVVRLLNLPFLKFFRFSVGRSFKTRVKFSDGGRDSSGSLIINGRACDVIDADMDAALLSFFKSAINKHVSSVTLFRLVGLSGMAVRAISQSPILFAKKSLKLLNCGHAFVDDDIQFVINNTEDLRFLAIVEGSETIGQTDIQFANNVVLAIMKDGVKWTASQVRQHRKRLNNEDSVWLGDETESGVSSEDESDSDN